MPYTYNPPHAPTDDQKLQNMIKTLEAGGELPPIVVLGETALTGSHRLRAWLECDIKADAVEIEDDDFCNAMQKLNLEPEDNIPDWNEFCTALFEVIDDPEIKAALKDQRE